MQRQRKTLAEAGQRFVGRVVYDFLDAVQRTFGTGVHARPLPDGLEALEDADRSFFVLALPGACHGGGF